MKTTLHSLESIVAPVCVRVWSAATHRRFPPMRHVASGQGAVLPAHSKWLVVLGMLLLLGLPTARAVDYHVATAQDLQNALTLAAANGADNNIFITNGYYTGNFNFNSTGGYNLTVQAEPSVTNNTAITIDGAGTGRDMNLANTGNITVSGITFSRNCGNIGIGALRIAGGGGSVILVNGCQFLSPAGTSGMGLEVASGLNATVTNCTAAGPNGGTGISISGVTGNVAVQNCMLKTNNNSGVFASGASVIVISGNVFNGNSMGSGGLGAGVSCFGTTITFSGNTFTGNSADYAAAGAFCGGTTVTLNNNTFAGNSAGNYGGVYCGGTTITLNNNTFINNSGYFTAGGATCIGSSSIGSITLFGNTFIGNTCGGSFLGHSGGGAFCQYFGGTSVTLSGNTFTGNSNLGGGGGGVCSWDDPGQYGPSSATVTLTNNTFAGNSGNLGGGAICDGTGDTVTIAANTFSKNSAATGGGIYVSSQVISLLDNLVVKNSSSSQGGGIWVNTSSNLFLINNTITANTSSGTGGGVTFQVSGTVELLNVYNNIIWGNTASGNGGDVWLGGTGQQKVFDLNDADSIYGVWDIAQNNIDAAPQFFDPVNGDYHTQSTSPCANAGTNGAPSLPLTDLDGNSRTNSAGLVDLGCYEFNTTATHPADTNAAFVITADEFNAYAAAWQNGQSWTNGPNPVPANFLTRAGYLMTNGGAYYNNGSARPVNWKLIGQ